MTAAEPQDDPARLPRLRPLPQPGPEPEPVETGPDGWAWYKPGGQPAYWRHEAFPHWYAWLGVPGTGYYARRPRSSPPKVVGPLPTLAKVAAAIAEAEVRR
jgi:hypothetical protein